MKVIGIDPGITGGISVCHNNKIIDAIPMPAHKVKFVKKEYNLVNFKEVTNFFKKHNPDKIYIELVGARPNQGTVSMFNFGFSTGGLHGVADALGIEIYTVMPQKWKKLIFESGTGDKDDAIAFCDVNCPDISLLPTKRSKTKSHGIADAICISIYGMKDATENINKRKTDGVN